MAFAEALERSEKLQYFPTYGLQLVPEEEFYINQDLVIPRASGMDLLSDIPEFPREQQLYLGMDVLHIVFKLEAAVFYAQGYPVKCFQQFLQFLGSEKADGL